MNQKDNYAFDDLFCFQIIAIGEKITVQFYGDRTTADLGPKNVFPISNQSLINVKKHEHKTMYRKALKEQIIDLAKVSSRPKKKVKSRAIAAAVIPVPKLKRERLKVESAPTCDRITRSKVAAKIDALIDVHKDTISGPIRRRHGKKPKTKKNAEFASINAPVIPVPKYERILLQVERAPTCGRITRSKVAAKFDASTNKKARLLFLLVVVEKNQSKYRYQK